MDIEDLRLFVLTARLSNLTEAARQLHVAKSSASRNLAKLEEKLGISLLYRSNRRILLTEAGTVFFNYARDVLKQLDEAGSALDELKQSPQGLLRVVVPVNPGQFLIAPLIGEFLGRYPAIDLRLILTSESIEPLTGEVDIAIRTGELRDSSLIARRLGVAHLGLYASPHYLAAHGAPGHPSDLGRYTLIDIMDRGDVWSLSDGADHVDIPVSPRLLVNDTTVIKTMLSSGHGLGWLPTYMCQDEVDAGLLVRILPDWSRGSREIHAVFACHRLISPKVRAFIDFFAERLDLR
jgi:DNA-binding transcriptional LysR family regulator